MPKIFSIKSRVAALLVASAAFFAPSCSVAAERPISLQDAYKLALANYENVKIAGEGILQAESGVDKALATFLPKLSAEAGYTKYSEKKLSGALVTQPDDGSRFDLKLTQPIFSGGTEWSARKIAKIRRDKSSAALGYVRQSVIYQTARVYYNALKSQKDVEIKRAALKRAEERLKVASARLRVGEVTKSAVLRAEAESARAGAELIKAESTLKDAMNLLQRILGVNEDVALAEPKVQGGSGSYVDDYLKTALDKRLDYKQAAFDQNMASEGITYAKGNFLPSLRFEGAYAWRDQNPTTTFLVRDSLSASVIFSYPLFEGGLRKAELSEARSKMTEAELRKVALRKDIEIEVREAFNNLESTRSLTESYKKQLSFAEEDYKMVFEQFKHGLSTTVDVIDSDASLISAQRSLMNAAYDYELAILKLSYTAGILSTD